MRIDLNKYFCISAVAGLLTFGLSSQTILAQKSASAEKSLLGIRVLQTYKDVMRKYGAPHGIYRNGDIVNMVEAVDAEGSPTGGILALGDSAPGQTMAATGGGRQGMMGGMPGGARGMGGGMFGPPGSMGGNSMLGSPGMMGGGARRAGFSGGMPGFGGGGGLTGMPGGSTPPGLPGSGVNTPGNGESTFASAGGFIWVYFYPKKELVYEFLFNNDGRVEMILQRGRTFGQKTSRGIGLGYPIKSLYSVYGWPDTLESQPNGLSLNYNQKYHVYFSVLKNKVNLIAVFLRENQKVNIYGTTSASTTTARGGMAGFGGMAGQGGMMSGQGGFGGKGGGRGSREED